MEQKIYAKFTKERLPQFQIETQIYEADGRRLIRKRALLPEGEAHIERLFENYEYFENKMPGVLAGVKRQGQTAEFEYIKGESFAKHLDDKVLAGDKEGFLELLAVYRELTRRLAGGTQAYEPTADDGAVLGAYPELSGVSAAYKVNADLTFDNIIFVEDGSLKVIDYEWIFDCLLPMDFPVYRALFAYYLRSHNELAQMISIEECREYLDITEEAWKCYEQMNEAFNTYIMGGATGYGSILTGYARKNISLDDIMAMNEEAAQIYMDKGAGFSEENSIRQKVETDGTLNVLEIKLTGEEKNVRMDPMNAGGLVELTELLIVDGASGKAVTPKIISTADSVQGNHYLFLKDDPQFVVKLKKVKAGSCLRFAYRILSRLTDRKM